MSSIPRILRAVPGGDITRPLRGIPVIAVIRWHVGPPTEEQALAIAWSRDAVEIAWRVPTTGEMRSDWLPVADVRRTADSPHPGPQPGPQPGA